MKENDTTVLSLNSTETRNEILSSINQQDTSKDLEFISHLMNIDLESNDILSIINSLNIFEFSLKTLKNISCVLKSDILLVFQKLAEKDNIPINLALKRIYTDILSNESLYKSYLLFENNYYDILDKVSFLLYFIDECTSLIEKLNGFVFDPELFKFKNKLLELIKCIYYNCYNKIKNEDKVNKLKELLDTLPSNFYSNSYLELNKNNDLYEVSNSQTNYKITAFEEKFLDLNNYFEQFEVFKKFVEINSNIIDNKNINNNEKINIINNNDNSEFYYNYALLLLKFCKYHSYIFLNKKESEEEKKENGVFEEEDNENARVVFLLDKFKLINANSNSSMENDQKLQKNEITQYVETLLQNKQFHSILDSKEYKTLIQKQINYYLEQTKNYENHPKIKSLRDQMIYYVNTLNINSFVPLYLKEFKKVTFSDNFTPAFSMNVPAGKANKIYLETRYNEQILVFIEFFLEDKTKDITFEVNKYDFNTNTFKQIYHEENIEDIFKFYVFCNGYSLYEIIFNNDYSWFNSKDINYRISLLKYFDKPKLLSQNDFTCNVNGKNILYNCEDILQRIANKENEKVINIPVIMYMNNLRIVTIEKNKDGKDDINFKEIVEQDEKYVPKHLFDYSLINYLIKLKISSQPNQKIIITIYSQNRDDLSKLINNDEKLKKAKDEKSLEFLTKIGFIPSIELGDYKVEYKLYDLCEQILIYHLFVCKYQKMQINKNILLLKFDKLVFNYAIYHEGKISTNIKEIIDNQNDKNEKNKDEYILNFIKEVNNIYGGINIVLSHIDYADEEKKKEIMELFEKIKKYCTEELEPKVPLVIYNDNSIDINAIKYINLFYKN